jgi:hypothetical protein
MGWVVIEKKGRGGGKSIYDLRMSRSKYGQVSFTVSAALLRLLRWKIGDRVDVMLDHDDRIIGIAKTDKENGRVLCAFGGTKGKSKKPDKACVRVSMSPKDLSLCVNGQAREFTSDQLVIDNKQGIVVVDMLSKQ